MKNTFNKSTAKTVLVTIGIVLSASILAASYQVDASGPKAEDYADLKGIDENQKIIEETRPAHERFIQAKQDNEKRVASLNSRGFNIDWASMSITSF